MISFSLHTNGTKPHNTFCREQRVLFRINEGNFNQSDELENDSRNNVIDLESQKITKAIELVQQGTHNNSVEKIIQEASLSKIQIVLQEKFTGNQSLTEQITNIHQGANTTTNINKSIIDDIAKGKYKKLNNKIRSVLLESPLSAVFQYLLNEDLREGYLNALVQMNIQDKKVQQWADKHGKILQNIPHLNIKEKGRLTEFIDLCEKEKINTLSQRTKEKVNEVKNLPAKIINLLARRDILGETSEEKKMLAETKAILPPLRYKALLKKVEQTENQDFSSRIELYISTIDEYIRTLQKNNIKETKQKKTK